MNETKTSTLTTVKNAVVRNKTRVAVAAIVATSVAANVVLYRSVSAHNEFLKEQGLFDQFYNIVTNEA
jgi:hypothetical protein